MCTIYHFNEWNCDHSWCISCYSIMLRVTFTSFQWSKHRINQTSKRRHRQGVFFLTNVSLENHSSKWKMWKIGSEVFKYATLNMDIGVNSELSSQLSQTNVLALSYKSITFDTLLPLLHTWLLFLKMFIWYVLYNLRVYAWNVHGWSQCQISTWYIFAIVKQPKCLFLQSTIWSQKLQFTLFPSMTIWPFKDELFCLLVLTLLYHWCL